MIARIGGLAPTPRTRTMLSRIGILLFALLYIPLLLATNERTVALIDRASPASQPLATLGAFMVNLVLAGVVGAALGHPFVNGALKVMRIVTFQIVEELLPVGVRLLLEPLRTVWRRLTKRAKAKPRQKRPRKKARQPHLVAAPRGG